MNFPFSSVAQLCLTFCDPMDGSTPGFHAVCTASVIRDISLRTVHHPLTEFTQTDVHWVGDALQPSHPLSSSSPPAFNLSQHQGSFHMSQLFTSCSYISIRTSALASVLQMNIQDWFPLGWTSSISLQSKGLWRVFSNITAQKHQFFSTQFSLWSNSHIHTWLLEKT